MRSSRTPDALPVLSRGKHWSPRRGACFMELASVLAGERWSDHPACTHPLLAALARAVNDLTSDGDRQALVGLVPSVVGRTGDDRTWLTLPVAVAASVVHDVPESKQRVLAGGLLQAERLCATDPAYADVRREARAALETVPGAVRWVEQLGVRSRITPKVFTRSCAPTMVRCAVEGVALGSPGDAARLRALLEVGIGSCPADLPSQAASSMRSPARQSSDSTRSRSRSRSSPGSSTPSRWSTSSAAQPSHSSRS